MERGLTRNSVDFLDIYFPDEDEINDDDWWSIAQSLWLKRGHVDASDSFIANADEIDESQLVGNVYEIQSTAGFKYAVGFESAVDAESEFLKTASVDNYIGIIDITDNLSVLLNERTDASDTLVHVRGNLCRKRGRFVPCVRAASPPETGGAGKVAKSKTKKTEEKTKKITDRTTIADMRALADKHGIKYPEKANRRQPWIDAIKSHPEGGQYFEKKQRGSEKKTATKVTPEVKPKKVVAEQTLEDAIKNTDGSDHKQLISLGQKLTLKHIDKRLKEESLEEKQLLQERAILGEKFTQISEARESKRKIDGKVPTLKAETAALQALRDSISKYEKVKEERLNKYKKGFENLEKELYERGIYEARAKELVDKIYFEGAFKNLDGVKQRQVQFFQLTGERASKRLQVISAESERAYAIRDYKIDVGKDGDATSHFHEAGHHYEYSSRDLTLAANSFRNARATSKTPVKLKDLVEGSNYDDHEVALPDKFISPYVGKVYQNNSVDGSTEVVSMGIQSFYSPQAMRRFHDEDEEHFNFIVGAILKKD